MRSLQIITGIAITFFVVSSVSAVTQSFTFSGEIFSVGSDLGSQVQVGDSYTFDIVYDSEAPITSFVSTFGNYPAISADLEISTSTVPYTMGFDAPRIEMQDQSSFQRITFSNFGTLSADDLNGRTPLNPILTLFSSQSPLPHNGLDLPTSFDLNDYSSNSSSSQLSLAFGDGLATELIKGSVDEVALNPIPEPGLAGLVLGMGGFALALRLRNRNAPVWKPDEG